MVRGSGVIVVILFPLFLGGCAGRESNGLVESGEVPEMTGLNDAYKSVFYGVLEERPEEHGVGYVLSNVKVIRGVAKNVEPLPLLSLSVVGTPPVEKPDKYIPGRRYMVFVAGEREGCQSKVVRIIDLDETSAEANVRHLFRSSSRYGLVSPISHHPASIEELEAWVDQVKENLSRRHVTVGTIVDVLGEPAQLDYDAGKATSIKATFLLRQGKWLTRESSTDGHVTYRCPRITITVEHGRVSGIEIDRWQETEVLSDMDELRDTLDFWGEAPVTDGE